MATKNKLDIKAILEKDYFGMSFEEIKNRKNFKSLKLTDDEIISNRRDIKIVLDSEHKCGNDEKFCKTLENNHYKLKRTTERGLILIPIHCHKAKKYEEISNEEMEKVIKELSFNNHYQFKPSEIRHLIEKYGRQDFERWIGDPDRDLNEPFRDLYIAYKNLLGKKKSIIGAKIHAFHNILIGKKIGILNAEEVKKICILYFWNYYKTGSEEIIRNYSKLINLDLLVIIGFGVESDSNSVLYFTDFFKQMIQNRRSNKKITYIISPINPIGLIEHLKEKINMNSEIMKSKIEELEDCLKTIFNYEKGKDERWSVENILKNLDISIESDLELDSNSHSSKTLLISSGE